MTVKGETVVIEGEYDKKGCDVKDGYIKVPCINCGEDIKIEGQAEEVPFGEKARMVRFMATPSKSSCCEKCGSKIVFQSAATLDGKFCTEFIFKK